MFPSVLRILSRTAFVLATTAVFSTSCSRQPEGERCDYQWAGPTQDCDSGLQCTPCGNLQNSVVDRCCRTDNTYSDPRCAPAAAPTQQYCNTHGTTNSSAGSGNTAGSGTAGSATSGGMSSVGGKAGASSSAGSEAMSGNSGEATAGGGG
jgi:hypothetical protein